MKYYLFSLLCILFPLSTIPSVQAQASQPSDLNQSTNAVHIAGFGIPGVGDVEVDVNIEDEASEDEASEAETTEAETSEVEATGETVTGFSGESEPYADSINGFAVAIPVEFELAEPGQTTNWTGPIMDEGAVSIYVNAAPLPGVDPNMLQATYRQQYEQDAFYTNVQTLTVPFGNGSAPALRAEEVTNKRGTNTQKSPDDIHRWHLIVFGNDRVYTWGFTGMFQTFQDNEVQSTYETVIDSVELVSID